LLVFVVPLASLSRSDILSSPVIVFVEVPKIAILRTLAGLMGALWLAEWILENKRSLVSETIPERGWERLRRWFRASFPPGPAGWVRLAAAFYFGSVLLSTLLSVSLPVSLWGEVPGQDGYSAYTTAAYAMVFAVIATHLKNQEQLGRLMAALAASGVLLGGYAVAQHFGADIFRLLGTTEPHRATSTSGNAIVRGSALLITLTVSLAAATANSRDTAREPAPRQAWPHWLTWMLWSGALAVQMLGLVYTFSRGPWVGTVFALVIFAGLVFLFAGWRSGLRGASILAAAAAITALVLFFPGPGSGLGTGSSADFSGGGVKAAERITSIGGQATGGGFSGRRDIWETSWRLM